MYVLKISLDRRLFAAGRTRLFSCDVVAEHHSFIFVYSTAAVMGQEFAYLPN